MSNEFRRREGNKVRVLDLLRSSGNRGAYNHELVAVGGMRAGQPGYLASLPILSSIDDNRHKTHTTDAEPAEGRLFR
jgi:hypothetical protein